MAAKPDLDVEIKGENYRLDTVPADTSSVVLAEKEKLLGAVDLKTLVNDLGWGFHSNEIMNHDNMCVQIEVYLLIYLQK